MLNGLSRRQFIYLENEVEFAGNHQIHIRRKITYVVRIRVL